MGPQIALDGPKNIGVVIHTQQDWFRHGRSSLVQDRILSLSGC
jgi:hypothetical protein